MTQSTDIASWHAKLQRVFDNKDGVDVLVRLFGMLDWHNGNPQAQELFIMICTGAPGAAKEIIDRMALESQKRLHEQIKREEGARK